MDDRNINIQKLTVNDVQLMRTPFYPIPHGKDGTLLPRLNDPLFRYAVAIASPHLFQEAEKRGFDLNNLPTKITSSLWKYMNRMTFRATPFALFSAFSAVRWDHADAKILLNDQLALHVQKDLGRTFWEAVSAEGFYTANSSLYKVNDSYRFFSYKLSGQEKLEITIENIEASPYLESLLEVCRTSAGKQGIVGMIADRFSFSNEEARGYVDTLIEANVLVPTKTIKIAGTSDDLKCIIFSENAPLSNESVKMLQTGHYLNLERPEILGGVPENIKRSLLSGVHALRKLGHLSSNVELLDFADAFTAKYDQRCVPLLHALDPEIGIGYGGLMQEADTALLQGIQWSEKETSDTVHNWSPVHQLLLRKWTDKQGQKGIQLTEEELAILPDPPAKFPNSISVLYTVLGKNIQIKQAGGTTATSLIGRFTPFNEAVYQAALAIAHGEEQANPHVLFCEVVHAGEIKCVNIERRKQLFRYEIPILVGSDLPEEFQVSLSDIYISAHSSELILWSMRHRKRIVPRLSSAYNYRRSQLSAFRFLCDLQDQGVQSDLYFDMQRYFPGLEHYPRVTIGNVILSLETWIINSGFLQEFGKLDEGGKMDLIQKFAKEKGWPPFVSVNEYDHQLVFQWQRESDCRQLVTCLRICCQEVVVREFPLPKSGEAMVTDKNGNIFMNEFVASVCHHNENYTAPPFPAIYDSSQRPMKRRFVPGSEWLYYKLYVHPFRANEIMSDHIAPAIKKLQLQKLTDKWFFVRYADPDHHLRIRLKLSPRHTGYALVKFEKALDKLAGSGIVQHYELETYEREVERYTDRLIDLCEAQFFASSMLVTDWLAITRRDPTQLEYYGLPILSVDWIMEAFAFDIRQQTTIYEHLFHSLSMRFNLDNEDKKSIRHRYRDLARDWDRLRKVAMSETSGIRRSVAFFKKSLYLVEDGSRQMHPSKRQQICEDLVHMQLNRLFPGNALPQEMVFYYACWMHTRSVLARATACSG